MAAPRRAAVPQQPSGPRRASSRPTPTRASLRGGTRVADRLARRDLVRHKARSALIIAMVALPLAVASALAVILGSTFAPAGVETRFGEANAMLFPASETDQQCHGCVPNPDGPRLPRLPALPGHDVVTESHAPVTLTWKGLDKSVVLATIDFTDPRLRSLYAPDHPQLPGPQEVAVNGVLAQNLGLKPGDRLRVGSTDVTVSQVVRTQVSSSLVLVGPDHPLAAAASRAYVFGPELTSTELTRLTASGVGAEFFSEAQRHLDELEASDAFWRATVMGIAVLAGLFGCLLTGTVSGAAFAIGLRQQRRSLALIAATGAPSRALQRIVTRNGLLLGTIGVAMGLAAGLGAGIAGVGWRNAHSVTIPQPLVIPWATLGGLALVGIAASVISAWVPARSVTRQDVLAGVRSPESAAPRAPTPWVGAVLVVAGLSIGLGGARLAMPNGDRIPVERVILPGFVCCVLIFVGVLLASGWVLDVLGRRTRGPLSWRLALRDGSRNRGRAAACVAASMAMTALVSGGLIALGTLAAEELQGYQPQMREGLGVVSSSGFTDEPLSAEANQRAGRVVVSVMGGGDVRPVLAPTLCGHRSRDCSPPTLEMQCTRSMCVGRGDMALIIADPALYRALTGRPMSDEVKNCAAERGDHPVRPRFHSGRTSAAQPSVSSR